jgi:hypothetical protein
MHGRGNGKPLALKGRMDPDVIDRLRRGLMARKYLA